MSCKILIYADHVEPVEFELNPGVYKIGSSPQASLSLNFAGVFENHADLEVHENGAVWLVNTSGDPELKVNEGPVRELELKEKDIISIGEGYLQITSIPTAEIVNSAGQFTGEPVLKLQKKSDSKKQGKYNNWWETFGVALGFPFFSGNVIGFLIAGLIISLATGLTVMGGLVGFVVNAALLYVIMQTINLSACQIPEKRALEGVSFLNDFDFGSAAWNLIKLSFMMLLIVIQVFLIGLVLYFAAGEEVADLIVPLIFCIIFPVPMLAFAMTESFGTINPVFIFQSIFRSPAKFLTAGIVLVSIYFLDEFFIETIAQSSSSGIVFEIIISTLLHSVFYCLLSSWACSLGMIYYFDKKELNWNI